MSARNPHILRVKCAKEGCCEISRFAYDTKPEYSEGYKRLHGNWRCSRHSQEEKVLTLERLQSNYEKEFVVVVRADIGGKHFWNGSNGFASGDAFKAWAKDFPAGTKLIVESTARIVLP